MQVIKSESLPLPELSRHLQAIICTCQATPTTPLPLLPTAPSTPATKVPCPLSSLGSLVAVSAFQPCPPSFGFTHMFAARSSCVYQIPESITATTMLLAEVSTSQPSAASMSACGVPLFCP